MDRISSRSPDRSVGIIIPAYNSSRFLAAAIESAIDQTYPASEIVVIDDGSTDDTRSVCDRYPTIKYIYQSNQGLPGARNQGIAVSQSEYLIFLDSDDRLLPDAIEIGVNCLAAHPEAGFVFGRYLFLAINPDGSYSTQQLFEEPPPVASYATILAAQHNIQCATAICRREAVASIGGFAPHQEDLNLWLRIAREMPIYFHDRVVSEYRYHGGNESSKSAKMLVQTMTTHALEWEYVSALGGSPELVRAYECGRATWIKFYGDRILSDVMRLLQVGASSTVPELVRLIWKYDPNLKYVDRETYHVVTELLRASKIQLPPRQSYPQTACVHQLFAAQVARTPDAIAITCDDRQLTYRELNEQANRLAHHLIALNVQPETLVGLSVERSVEMVIGILGILKAGGAYVPLDPTYPQERLDYMLADAQVPVLVTMAHLAASFEGYSGRLVCLDTDVPDPHDLTPPTVVVTPDNLAYVIYTSGSTGKPKGVLITHANVGRLFAATEEWYGFNERDVWTMFHSYAFDFSVWELWGALIYGGRLVIVPLAMTRSPQDFYELLARERVTILNQTPSAFRQLLRVATAPTAELALNLRSVIFGGEALDLPSLQPWFAKFGQVPQLVNMYGITETTVHVTYRPIDPTDLARGSAIGQPIPDLELYILDPDLQPVASGVAGEMYIAGAGVARGYLNRPELTAERFIAHPFAPDAVLYKTGDLARYLPDGDIEYLGRIDNQVKIRGFRIELGEIEATLNQNPQIQAAVTIVREDEPGDLRIVAYLVPATGTQIDIPSLRASLQQQLPEYMVPAAFVCLMAIPLTANGKIDRQALPAPARANVGSNFVAADTATEAVLSEIWQASLRLEQVGVTDNFFDLGGNSLLGLTAIESIQTRFKVKVSPVRLYQYPTVRSMAKYLRELRDGQPKTEVISLPNRSQPVVTNSVAVIGMVGRFPGANSVEQLWDNLCAGREAITWFDRADIDPSVDPELSTDPNYVCAKGVLAGAELFDASFFGMTEREAQMMDPQARILMELASEALETVGYVAAETNKIGVYAGSAENTYFERHLSSRPELIDRFGEFQTHLVNDRDYFTTRTSYKLNLQGPSINVSTACSTSLVAIIQAYQGLLNHQCDIALAGGVAIDTPQNRGYLHQEGSIFTPDGHCRPFDANAQGTLFNSGGALVVLKRLDEAISAGDRIYAVIKGVGINNDGADKVSFTAPSINGQMGAILQAQAQAGIEPDTISYIEAHGTATALGDPIEVEALTQAFRTKTLAKQFCGIGSIKSNLGHLTAAAGVAGFIKTVLALHHQQIPPSINYDRPNPHIDFANSPFYVNAKLTNWKSDSPRRAGVSSFGGGGTNAHVILEQAPASTPSSKSRPYQLLLLSAKTATALAGLTSNLRDYLQSAQDPHLADIAATLQQGRKRYSHRRFVVCQHPHEAIDLVTAPPQLTTSHTDSQTADVVMMFSGQGSQYLNMGRDLYQREPVFQAAIDTCTEILQPLLGRSLREIIYPSALEQTRSTELLSQTRYTQPALFAVEYALAQLWQSWGIRPQAAIGHSIGEFVAACLAGVFSLTDALQLVAQRGQLMWDLPAGAMLSVRLPAAEIASKLTPELAIAAINSPVSCVVSGSIPAIEQLQQELEAATIACKLLQTSHAFHSPMMAPIVAPFAAVVAGVSLSPPQIPFISLVTGDWITDAQATAPQYWADHLRQPVQFARGVQTLWERHPNYILLEVGPRQTLTTLARQQFPERVHQVIPSLGNTATPDGDWQFVLPAIGQLWLAGANIDWQQFYCHETRHRVPLPTYPFERQKFWIDPLPHPQNLAPLQPTATANATPPVPIHNSPMTPAIPAPTISPRFDRLIPEIAAVIEAAAGVKIGTHDRATFLELGLDSLSLTQVALSLKKKFKVPVTFRQLLEDCSTMTTLARSIDLQMPPDADPAPVIAPPTPSVNLPVQAAPSPISPPATLHPLPPVISPGTNSGNLNAIESLIQQQLQIMARQLELLSGDRTPSVPPSPPAPSTGSMSIAATEAMPTPVAIRPVSSSHHHDNGHQPSPGPAPGLKINRSIDTSLNPCQQAALADIIERYVTRTATSKRQAQAHRRYLADPRTVSGFTPLLKEMVYPIVTDRAKGSRLWDEDGNEYIDLTNGFGLNFFGWSPDFITDALKAQLDKGMAIGPQTPLAGRVAKKIAQFTGMERVAFCNTGSEAVMAALRIARTVTGRDRVVIFAGSYHGTFDEVLFRAAPDLQTLPSAPGVMASALTNILVLDYDSPQSLAIIREYADDIAAVIVEPVQSRRPNLQPQAFLHDLRALTEELDIALIIDEVITGFRVAPGGAQEYFGVKADIATYGKVVGGGMPIGILTGAAKYLDALDGGFWQFGDRSMPEVGVTFFAGTFVRHPLALAAVEAILTQLEAGGAQLHQTLDRKVADLVQQLAEHCQLVGLPLQIEHFSSFFYLTLPPSESYGSLLFYLLREKSIHIWENRPCFLTLAHSDADIEQIIWAFKASIAELQSVGFLSSSGQAIAVNHNLPPQPGARLGKDRSGNPAWFIADPDRSGQYLQVDGCGA